MDCAQRSATESISNYISETIFEARSHASSFEKISCVRWAANEALDAISNHSQTPPLIVLEELKEKMQRCIHVHAETNEIFQIATDTIDEIVHLLVSQ